MDRKSMLKEAEAVVLRGLATGYASDARAKQAGGKPDSKYYEYWEGEWYLRDEYCVDKKTGKSVGRTTLELRDATGVWRLIWQKCYGGWYHKATTSVLKGALLKNYSAGVFNGGRGPAEYTEGEHTYRIVVFGQAGFENFTAFEWITHPKEPGSLERVEDGRHNIMGMALI